jgi:hypothetical protein
MKADTVCRLINCVFKLDWQSSWHFGGLAVNNPVVEQKTKNKSCPSEATPKLSMRRPAGLDLQP